MRLVLHVNEKNYQPNIIHHQELISTYNNYFTHTTFIYFNQNELLVHDMTTHSFLNF